jgi:H+/gluconate symporter-like permease
MTQYEWLVIAWIGLSTTAYFVSILWLAPKLSARRWQQHFEEEQSAQEGLLKILMGDGVNGVIPVIVTACGEVVTEKLKKTMQGYQGKSMQMLEKNFDTEGALAINRELDEYPFYVKMIMQKVLEKYGGALSGLSSDQPEAAPILDKIGLDTP